ncbi:MAG: glycerol-3-phosphate dehydrogenase/oxidase, partial [Aggregatilineales bacterium]
MKTRQIGLDAIRENPEIDVLIIGGGINGVGTFRELALEGVSVVLAERNDFCSGASAASSHMLHGGIRYLENGEFRLVREALHERNQMLMNAPHYAKPLPTTVPMFKWLSGLFNAPFKFLNLMNKPAERGAVVIKAGMTMYDLFAGRDNPMDNHEYHSREESLKKFPQMNPEIVASATYFDAFMPSPERICIDLLNDAEAANDNAIALNYMPVIDGEGDRVTLQDCLSDETYEVKPKVVINAGGPWIDFINKAMEFPTTFIGGTKGSHLILDNPDLLAATSGHEIFFENDDGRIVLILPYLERVMVGTTDIRLEDPDEAVCTQDEVDYILGMVNKVFPNIPVNDEQIVFRFSGVRPLPASPDGYTGNISRDHSIRSIRSGGVLDYPVHSLIGGKWTSFRAFSAQTAKLAMSDLGKTRRIDTSDMAIGGGKNYPSSDVNRAVWLKLLSQETGLALDRVTLLFERYGTTAEDIAHFCIVEDDAPLTHLPSYTRREVQYLAEHEKIIHIDDMLLRRSLIA